MLDNLLTSKTRLKILLKFFLNSNSSAYLRNLEEEFDISKNSIRTELMRFEKAGLLKSWLEGNKKLFSANTDHPLYSTINKLIMKHIGFDKIIDTVIEKIGKAKYVFVVGDFAQGIDNNIIDLIFVGDHIDQPYLSKLVNKAEKMTDRRIRYLIYSRAEFKLYKEQSKEIEPLLLWKE